MHFFSYLLSPLSFWKPLLFHAQTDRQEGDGVEWWRECTVHFTAVALTGWVMGQYWNGQSGRPLLITQALWCARLLFEPCFSFVCICLVFFRVAFFQGHVGIVLAHTLPDCQVGWTLKHLSCLPCWNTCLVYQVETTVLSTMLKLARHLLALGWLDIIDTELHIRVVFFQRILDFRACRISFISLQIAVLVGEFNYFTL